GWGLFPSASRVAKGNGRMSHFFRPQWRQYLEYGQAIFRAVKKGFLQRGHGQKECQYENTIASGMSANVTAENSHGPQGSKRRQGIHSRNDPNHTTMAMTNPLRILRYVRHACSRFKSTERTPSCRNLPFAAIET